MCLCVVITRHLHAHVSSEFCVGLSALLPDATSFGGAILRGGVVRYGVVHLTLP